MATALLVLDVINDIVHPEGKFAGSANYVSEKNTINNINRAIAIARANHFLIIFVKVGFSEKHLECPTHSPLFGKIKAAEALKLNTWDTDFHNELDIRPEDIVVVKHRVSAFYATSLEAILKVNHVDTVWLTGVSTNMVIESTAREAHDRDYHVVILEDACAAATQEIHDSAIALLSRIASISQTSEIAEKSVG